MAEEKSTQKAEKRLRLRQISGRMASKEGRAPQRPLTLPKLAFLEKEEESDV